MAQYTEYCDKPTAASFASAPQKSASLTEEFGYALTDIEALVSALRDQLGPVLTPIYPAEADGPSSPFDGAALRLQLHRTHAVAATLRSLIDRLEV